MLTNIPGKNKNRILLIILLLILAIPIIGYTLNLQFSNSIESFLSELNGENGVESEIVSITPHFFYSLGIDILLVLLIILIIYYPNYKKLDTIFTFIVFNIVIFLLTFVLNKVKISMGAAFGLFAVFSMLRYRTEGIDMKDMTYLFIFIALGLICGIQLDLQVLLVICAVIFMVTLVLDSRLLLKREYYQFVQFEKIEMIIPELREELIEELKRRTGLNIHRITICKLDYLKDVASIRVYYYE
ncbi:MAG TPA: DUF4956 domain-containing protein [Lentimicrobium sp.]|nr:DUF4956 domain-containing protein [Lentimicrobium sp.]